MVWYNYLVSLRKKIQERRKILNVDTLIIDGKPYSVNNLTTLPVGLNLIEIATPTIGDTMIASYGKQSPLSNFHPTKLNVQGMEFDDNEMFYQKKKSEFGDDKEAGTRIMKATKALDCYKIGLEINKKIDIQAWHSGPAIQALKEGLKAKFEQNTNIRNFLLNTKGKSLVEASMKDLFWGCGIALRGHVKMLDIHWASSLKTFVMS